MIATGEGVRRYLVVERLGQGGFARVLRARALGPGGYSQDVAIKLVDTTELGPDEALRRLRDEARILALINHRAVVKTHGLVRLDVGWAIILEYIEGVDCAHLLAKLAVPPKVACAIGEEVAGALDAAWRASTAEGAPLRVLHRDIKPGNIRLAVDGAVKVLDFGAARADLVAREGQTRSFVLGSHGYMAPERYTRDDQPASDIYSLGVVLAELFAAQSLAEPAIGATENLRFRERAGRALTEQLRSMGCPADATEGLRVLVDEMLAFSPEQRPSASKVAESLRRIRAPLQGPSTAEWAALARRVAGNPAGAHPDDEMSGSILLEVDSEGRRPRRSPSLGGVAPGLLAAGCAGGLFALLAVGVAVKLLWPRATPEAHVVSNEPPAPASASAADATPPPPATPIRSDANQPAPVGATGAVDEPPPPPNEVAAGAAGSPVEGPPDEAVNEAVEVDRAPEVVPPVVPTPVGPRWKVGVMGDVQQAVLIAPPPEERRFGLPAEVPQGRYMLLVVNGDGMERRVAVFVRSNAMVHCDPGGGTCSLE